MEVRLRLNWDLGRNFPDLPDEEIKLVLSEGTSIGELLEEHGIPAEKIGLISVNGCIAKTDSILKNQDDVQLYPPLEGG
jgi:sulfur carrier protein ThiS